MCNVSDSLWIELSMQFHPKIGRTILMFYQVCIDIEVFELQAILRFFEVIKLTIHLQHIFRENLNKLVCIKIRS